MAPGTRTPERVASAVFVGDFAIVNGFTARDWRVVYARSETVEGDQPRGSLETTADRRRWPGAAADAARPNGERGGQLDIPVESWEAYKTWCDRIRENWREDRNDPPPPKVPPNA